MIQHKQITTALKEAGFDIWVESVGPLPVWIERFYEIAFANGHNAGIEEAAKIARYAARNGEEATRMSDAIISRKPI